MENGFPSSSPQSSGDSVASQTVNVSPSAAKPATRLEGLTRQDREIIELIIQGATNRLLSQVHLLRWSLVTTIIIGTTIITVLWKTNQTQKSEFQAATLNIAGIPLLLTNEINRVERQLDKGLGASEKNQTESQSQLAEALRAYERKLADAITDYEKSSIRQDNAREEFDSKHAGVEKRTSIAEADIVELERKLGNLIWSLQKAGIIKYESEKAPSP